MFSSDQWEDVNEPLRNITHPGTPKLATVNLVLFAVIIVGTFVFAPSYITGIFIGLVGFIFAYRNMMINNTKYNPVSKGVWKNVVNWTSITIFVWLSVYLLTCIATEISLVLDQMTP